MANTWISRAATGSVTSDKTFTYSIWFKRGASNGSNQYLWIHENASGHTQKIDLHLRNDDLMRMGFWNGSNEYNLDSKMLFRDTNAWYHIVFRFDTTQSTASDRIRWYVNGEQIELTAIGGGSPTPQYPAQNTTMNLGQKTLVHGRYQSSNPGSYWTGSMSHIHYCDGQSYAPTEFGETDSTTGEWKIKTSPSVTYGNNGYFILKDGNSVTNQAGNSSGNFSVSGGTLTKTEDCPSNIFNTWNSLDDYYEAGTFYNGNTTYQTGTATGKYSRNTSTLGMTKGKFYWEVKPVSVNASIDFYPDIGITSTQVSAVSDYLGKQASDYSIESDPSGTNRKRNNNTHSEWGTSFALNDIVGVAVDLDNRKIYFSKNGVWMESGNPASGSTGTGSAYTITAPADTPLGAYFPSVGNYDGTGYVKFDANFGNGYFGTTAVASAGTNASGNGIFEYDVPSGYTALSTKGLNL